MGQEERGCNTEVVRGIVGGGKAGRERGARGKLSEVGEVERRLVEPVAEKETERERERERETKSGENENVERETTGGECNDTKREIKERVRDA